MLHARLRAEALLLIPLLLGCSAEEERPRGTATTAGAIPAELLDPGGRFVGSDTCGLCHEEIFAAQRQSAMARTGQMLKPRNVDRYLPPHLMGKPFTDPYTGSVYQFVRKGKTVTSQVRTPEGESMEIEVTMATGSGKHAHTFISVVDESRIVEHRVSQYTYLDALGVTPGQGPSPRHPLGLFMRPSKSRNCLHCHGTGLRVRPDESLDLSSYEPGVGCERCHGPGGRHVEVAVEAQKRGVERSEGIEARTGLDGPSQTRFCGQCHRTILDAGFRDVLQESHSLVRHAGIGVSLSLCFRRSSDFGCLTCHDPHQPAGRDTAFYDGRCLRCHDSGSGAGHCPVGPTESCVSCHMPDVLSDTGSGQIVPFTDHWIRAERKVATLDEGELQARARERPDLVQYLVAAYEKALEADPAHVEARSSLAMALKTLGRFDDALREFEAAVAIDPLYVPAWADLVLLYMQRSDRENTIRCCERILDADPTNPNARRLLAQLRQ